MVKINHFKLAFIIIGSVIGAGFITGRELIRFFGSSNFIPSVYTASILLFFFSLLLMEIGKTYGTLQRANTAVFKKYARLVKLVTFVSLIIICAGMLAGIDSLVNTTFSLPSYLPFLSVIAIILANYISGKGLDGIARISMILVPIMVTFILFFLLKRKNFSYEYTENYNSFNAMIMSVFYASMNMFLAAPLLISTGGKYKKGLRKGALLASITICFCIILILSAICYEGSNAIMLEMPMLYITGYTGLLAKIFIFIVIIAMFTSLVSAYFPLHHNFENDSKKKQKRIIISLIAFLLSRFGLTGIVQYLYPILGFFGALYLIICAVHLLRLKKSVLPFNNKFFNKNDKRIHNTSK